MFKVGDKIQLNECPFDKKKDINFYNNIKEMIHVVKEVHPDNSNLVKTNLIDDWVHRNWFFYATKVIEV